MRRLASTRSAVAAAPLRIATRAQARVLARVTGDDAEAGMTVAEYAVGTVAACGFGGVLYKVVTSPQVLDILKGVIGRAFNLDF
jgi:hypothetical protein